MIKTRPVVTTRTFRAVAVAAALVTAGGLGTGRADAQELPLAPVRGTDQGIWPAFEGWYENADGTYTLYFGYFNRNAEQVVDIPIGERNFIEPAELDGGQPTRFHPRRHWGVFGVRVPPDFGTQRTIYWNLIIDERTYRVPGHLRWEWKTDALRGEAGSGNTPPVLRLGSAEGAGPGGVTAPEILSASVGRPLEVRVWAMDDGRPDTAVGRLGPADVPVTLTWFKHQGPGDVTFGVQEAEVPVTGGAASTTVTFDAPGDYVLRVRANDASGVSGAGHAQCCWTNGFVKVAVTP
jgi:hypothetical protein